MRRHRGGAGLFGLVAAVVGWPAAGRSAAQRRVHGALDPRDRGRGGHRQHMAQVRCSKSRWSSTTRTPRPCSSTASLAARDRRHQGAGPAGGRGRRGQRACPRSLAPGWTYAQRSLPVLTTSRGPLRQRPRGRPHARPRQAAKWPPRRRRPHRAHTTRVGHAAAAFDHDAAGAVGLHRHAGHRGGAGGGAADAAELAAPSPARSLRRARWPRPSPRATCPAHPRRGPRRGQPAAGRAERACRTACAAWWARCTRPRSEHPQAPAPRWPAATPT
jgi:hypothetical protein